MEINWSTYKQIVLNDKSTGYRPDKRFFKRMRRLFPDISFFGFGVYHKEFWFILADSSIFPQNAPLVPGMHQLATPLTEALKWVPTMISPIITA
jgi:hypothetical protein